MNKLIIIFIFALLPVNCFSATLFFDPPGKNVKEGEQFSIEFKVNTEAEFVNAVEGVIEFPKNLIKPVHIDISNSVISAWIEEPQVHNDKISFSGIIAGGFDGVRKPLEAGKYPGTLFKIVFEAKKIGSDAMVVESIKVLKNDGFGSELDSVTIPFAINIIHSDQKNLRPNFTELSTILILSIIVGAIIIVYVKRNSIFNRGIR